MAAMALSITPVTRASGLVSHVSRSPRLIIVDAAIGSAGTYPSGGVPLNPVVLNQGITQILALQIIPPVDNTRSYVWDATNQKLRIYNRHQLQSGKSVTVTGGVTPAYGVTGGLRYLPTAVLGVYGTISSSPTNFLQIEDGKTPATGQFAVNYTTGVMSFYSADSAAGVLVDYMTDDELSTLTTGDTLGGSGETLRLIIWGY